MFTLKNNNYCYLIIIVIKLIIMHTNMSAHYTLYKVVLIVLIIVILIDGFCWLVQLIFLFAHLIFVTFPFGLA